MRFRFELATGAHADTIAHYSALNEAKNIFRETILISNMALTSYIATEKYSKSLARAVKIMDNHDTSRKFKN